MKLNARGIVLKSNPYGESNRVITVLTAELGVIRAFVHGAASLKSKNNTSTSLMSYSNFSLSSKGDTYTVDEASAIEIFFDIRGDIERSSLAQYFCEIFAFFSPAESEAEEYLRLILNSLALLSKGEKDPLLIKSVCELYLMKLSGYMPELSACAECGNYESNLYFDINNGILLCENCSHGLNLLLEKSVWSAMRYILSVPFERIFSFSLNEQNTKSLSSVTEKYLINTAERGFKTLDFYKTITTYD